MINWFLLPVVVTGLWLAGCASVGTSVHRNYAEAVTAQAKGDWNAARQAWEQVMAASHASGATARQQAVYHYEYGRSLGVTCFFDKAEHELLDAYRLDRETEGPAYMSLTELARLNMAQKNFAEAVAYFEQMLNEVDEKVLREAPIGYADILDEYAAALTDTGREERAAKMHKEALEIRAAHPQSHSITERTPYASQCH